MQPCEVNSCTLPADYTQLTEDKKAQVEFNCWITNAGEARECARRHKHLTEWINAD